MEGRATARFVAAAGRERELDTLVDAHEQARTASAPMFARVHGPAGIGKTHLVRALARRLGGTGVPVIEARSGRARGEALGIVRELARGLLALASDQGAAPFELAAITSRLAPLLDGPAARTAEGRRPEDLRLDVADALAELLRMCLPSAPALILDDLDAADRGSLELLQYLAALLLQPGGRHGCLVVLAYRDGRLPDALAALVDRVPGLHLPLAPLDVEGVRSFLARPDVAVRLFEATSGDPSRLEAVLSRSPADLGARRLARLEPEAQRVLLAAALFGRGVSPSLLRSATDAPDVARVLERLVAEGFLRVHVEATGPTYGFVREADRESVLAAAAPERLAEGHVAVAAALEATGAGVEEIARHYLAGDPHGLGARWAARAAEILAARCAFDAAIEFFHAALAGDGGDRRALHLGLAAAYEATGDMLAALRHLGLSRRGADPARRREARSEAARLCIRIGKLAQAERLCRIVLDGRAAFDPDDPAAARAWVDLAEIRFLRSDYEGAMAAANAGIPLAGALPRLRLGLRNTLGKALLTRGRHAEAAAAFHRNVEEADAAGLLREAMLARINEGVAHHRRGDREKAIRLYREGLALGDDRSLVALALGNLAVLYHEVGEFELALEHYGSALAAFTLVRRGEGVAHQGINRARLLLFLGDHAQARDGVEHAREEAVRLGNPYLVAQAELVRGEIALSAGDPAAARADLARARTAFDQLGSPRYVVETDIALVRTALAAGETAGALELLASVEASAAALDSADLDVEIALLAAEVALATRTPEQALPRLEAARESLLSRPRGVGGDTDLEAPWRLYDLLGRCHDALGRCDTAAAHLQRARSLLEELRGRVPASHRASFAEAAPRARVLGLAESEIGTGRAGAVRRLAVTPAFGQAIVGKSPALLRLLRRVPPLGRSLSPVLLRGESGTGKELLAEALHAASARAALPLVKVNCGAAGDEQLLAELVGADRAHGGGRERRGRFEQAHGGTIFLDEIGDLSPQAQVVLLHVLEEKRVERPGGEPVPVDVRVLCATGRNLEERLSAGRFREDLYYRLKGVVLELPPLRERREDIPALAEHFLARLRAQNGAGPLRFSPEALALLASWSWPGNVRELENLVAAVAIFAEGETVGLPAFELHGEFLRAVRAAEPAGGARGAAPQETGPVDFYALAQARGIGVRELRHELELQMIGRALSEAKGNISEAARLLQMKRSRLSQIVNAEPELLSLAKGGA